MFKIPSSYQSENKANTTFIRFEMSIFYTEGKNVSLFDDLFCEYSLLDNCVYKEKIICIITVFLRLIIK